MRYRAQSHAVHGTRKVCVCRLRSAQTQLFGRCKASACSLEDVLADPR